MQWTRCSPSCTRSAPGSWAEIRAADAAARVDALLARRGRYPVSRLTDADRCVIAEARAPAGLSGPAIRAHTRERDLGMAMAAALGEAQHLLWELAAIIELLAGESPE
jgi:hypothetical protein